MTTEVLNAADAERQRKLGRQTAIVVLGMHRSGTSMLANLIAELGVTLPKNLIGASPGNDRGHFEPREIVVANDRLLARLSSDWRDWRRLPADWEGNRAYREHSEELERLVRESYGDARVFVLKDPRLCRCFPLMLGALSALQIGVSIVLPYRHFDEVAASLFARDGISFEHAVALWIRHLIDAELGSRGQARVFINYPVLLENWREQLPRLADALGVANGIPATVGLVPQQSLRHHVADLDHASFDGALTRWAEQVLAAYDALASNPSDTAALERLDRIKREFDAASEAVPFDWTGATLRNRSVWVVAARALAAVASLRDEIAAMTEAQESSDRESASAGAIISQKGIRTSAYDIINFLGRSYDLRSYLEICTPISDLTFSMVDPTWFSKKHRMVYRVHDESNDGQPCTFRTAAASSRELTEKIFASANREPEYDLILVDPWNTLEATREDLEGAWRLLRPNGFLIVRDCNPANQELANSVFQRGEWCGETYRAFIDFVAFRPDARFCTVDLHNGCGVIRKLGPSEGVPAYYDKLASVWLLWAAAADDAASRYRIFDEHRNALLRLSGSAEFVAKHSAARAGAVRRFNCRIPPLEVKMVGSEFQKFLAERVEPIQGWLHQEAALLTAHLVGVQRELGLAGPTLEIGVFRGKYLSVLYKLSQQDELVFGVDLFVGATDLNVPLDLVRTNITTACGDAGRLKILATDSLLLTADGLQAEGADNLRFVSIDGGHIRELVLHDLEVAYPLLRPGGVIALDDAFNHTTPGVTEGLTEFFFRFKPKLAPFAHCYNKLFLTTPDFHKQYLDQTWKFVEEATWLATHERTQRRRTANRNVGFAPSLFGYEIVPFL